MNKYHVKLTKFPLDTVREQLAKYYEGGKLPKELFNWDKIGLILIFSYNEAKEVYNKLVKKQD